MSELESIETKLNGPRKVANWLIYSSIGLGVILLSQLYSLLPTFPLFLFYSVLAGWIAYLMVGIAVTYRVKLAYPLSLVLAVLTLAVSLPQPEHYSFGLSLASLTFVAGSILQIGVILAVGRLLLLKRRPNQA